ncbi:MAG: NAD(+) synthase [Gammaproteobacteria bacterium]|nr:MAG: NAD(+) synthase [Gammaproteobacteria bacterium]
MSGSFPSLKNALNFDAEAEVARITQSIRDLLRTKINRRGLVIGISGGVDSAVCAALCVKAIGAKKVFGLLMPEQDSSDSSISLGELVARHLEIDYQIKNISSTLTAIGCYEWRDQAIKNIFPAYDGSWKNKIAIEGGLEGKINHFKLIVEKPNGELLSEILPLNEYLTIVAATNFKQRVRKTTEYFHAERLNYAVIGTPNRLEYDQGFFVKGGDGLADIKPIAHLYKSQVYALARYLGLPDGICNAIPSTDTYSLQQGQDEFYFALPYQQMDLALWGYNHGVAASEIADELRLSTKTISYVYKDIEAKRKTTRYLHLPAQVLAELEVGNHNSF